MTEKIKLLLVADTYYPKVDGTLRFLEEFIKRAHSNFEISLLVPNFGKKSQRLKKSWLKETIFVEPSKHIQVSGYPNMKLSLKNFKTIKNALQNADLVFVQGPALISYLSLYLSRRYGKKTLFYTHTISWDLFAKFFPPLLNKLFLNFIKKISIYLYNRCDEIIVPYQDLKTELVEKGVNTKMAVARLGVDIDLLSPSHNKGVSKEKIHIGKNKTVIGYMGRISKEKNAGILLEAFRKLPNQENSLLLMVGDGPEEQVKEFKETKNCKITGFVDDVHKYLKAMDIFVMPSLTETTSLATLEAMSTGLPVIVTKVGFMKKYVVKNHNGIFFPRNSSTLLTIKIEQLLKNEHLRLNLGKNARKTIAYSFSWERSINKIKRILLEEFYRE
jgi:glycosyltransferase involved in cell wall biosynthesis